jgi:GT2 family glycosyltransferase
VTGAPNEVVDLARRRAEARAARDFAAADGLRDEITALGWVVADSPEGFTLSPRPPFEVVPTLAALPDRSAQPDDRRCGVGLLVEGWPDDLRRCVEAIVRNAPDDVVVVGLDLGDVDGAGHALHELALAHPGRVEEWHVAQNPQQAGWGPGRQALMRLDTASVHVLMDPSTVLDGDALTPLLDALDEPGVVAAGWRGTDVDVDDAWRSFQPAGPGEVDALLGYLMAVRRDALRAVGGPHPKARFYRNADMELSLALREAGGRLVVPAEELPVHQERHRGYHDSDPEYRDRESRKTYDRLLQRFRGKTGLLAPRV